MIHPLDRDDLRARVQAAVLAELDHQEQVLAEVGDDLSPLTDPIRSLLAGGKRLRAAFAYWGYQAGGGGAGVGSDAVVRLAAAMEFFQAAALVHDDVMDGSDTRRGAPSAHRAVATLHATRGWSGDPDRFGEAGAILAGDLCLQWADELYSTCGLPPEELARGRATFDRMRTLLMGGQFLDLLESARGWAGLDTEARLTAARRVIRFKSAKYSIEQPVLVGALVGGVPESAVGALSDYGLALGEAFQLRDDLLGVFGDPGETGKPAGDDLREGKRTVLLAYALDTATAQQQAVVEAGVGRAALDASDVAELRATLQATGAVGRVEADIAALCTQAHEALARAADCLAPEPTRVLSELVEVATSRTA